MSMRKAWRTLARALKDPQSLWLRQRIVEPQRVYVGDDLVLVGHQDRDRAGEALHLPLQCDQQSGVQLEAPDGCRGVLAPPLGEVLSNRRPEFVMNMILNPNGMLKEDPIAIALYEEYNNAIMLNQNLSEEEARALAEYLRTL